MHGGCYFVVVVKLGSKLIVFSGCFTTSRGAEVRVTLHWTTSEGRSYRSMVQSEPINLKLLTITNNGELITTMSVTSDS